MEIITKYSVDTPVFFTSDSHFCHKNIIEFCSRPFETVEEMNEKLVENWNKVVGPSDIVYHLGDFCFAGSAEWHYLLGKLNGRIHLIIGNHDEKTGTAVSDISAALILADKSDVHRDRVVNTNLSTFDKHDKVNYAVTNSSFTISKENRKVILDLTIDTSISPVLDYFEIFMDRTMMSKHAANFLNIWFELIINDTKLL